MNIQFLPFKNNIAGRNFASNPVRQDNVVKYRNSLTCDTVSFSGKSTIEKDIRNVLLRADKVNSRNYYNTAINLSMAKEICKGAVEPMKEFRRIIKDVLSPLLANDRNYERPIETATFRIKTSKSVLEKLNSLDANSEKKFNESLNKYSQGMDIDENSEFPLYESREEALKAVTDIIGGRIIMRDPSKFSVSLVLQALGKAVHEGKLVVTEVENYRPVLQEVPPKFINAMRKSFGIKLTSQQISDMLNPEFFSYANSSDLKNFADICKAKNPNFKLAKPKELKSGYQGLHIGFKLENGYTAELQIFGRDVDALKEIEDIRYKTLCNKINKPTSVIEKRMAQLILTDNEKLKKEHAEYTFWAYIAQRLKGVIRYKEPINTKFLSGSKPIKEAGLDYNELYVHK